MLMGGWGSASKTTERGGTFQIFFCVGGFLTREALRGLWPTGNLGSLDFTHSFVSRDKTSDNHGQCSNNIVRMASAMSLCSFCVSHAVRNCK
jgi:hypothetical protein